MAEGLWRKLGKGKWESYSAGSKPAGYVHPMAIEVMQEIGVDLSQSRSKHVEEFTGQSFDRLSPFDNLLGFSAEWPDPVHAAFENRNANG